MQEFDIGHALSEQRRKDRIANEATKEQVDALREAQKKDRSKRGLYDQVENHSKAFDPERKERFQSPIFNYHVSKAQVSSKPHHHTEFTTQQFSNQGRNPVPVGILKMTNRYRKGSN